MRRTCSDLILGARLAATGGSDSRLRAVLTALGVAFGVALLLFAASVPNMVSGHNARLNARSPQLATRRTSLVGYSVDTTFRGSGITVVALQRTGPHPPLPPGVTHIPAPGEMLVSPALERELRAPSGAELAHRLDARVVGTIADGGLTGPADLYAYRGATGLRRRGASYVGGWGIQGSPSGHSALVTLLVILMTVALLMPVGVFVATASRFGSEQRNIRLASLRLLGLDRAGTARVAAGESLLGAIAGVVVGVIGFYVILRPLVPHTDIAGVSVFAQDVRPSMPLAVLALVLVPVAAVGFALLAMRQVAIEPLGVSRRGRPPRRRLAWRLGLPVLGFLLLAGLIGNNGRLGSAGGEVEAAAGIIFVLIGVCALLPWFVEAVVMGADRGDGGVWGSVSWLLAIRRLRLDHGTSGRVVGAIGLAVAGAIALQTVFSGAESVRTGSNSATPQGLMVVNSMVVNRADPAALVQQRLGSARGVASVVVAGTPRTLPVSIVTCSTIKQITQARSCGPTSSYLISGSANGEHPGQLIRVPGGSLRIPVNAQPVKSRPEFQADGGSIEIGLSLNSLVLTPAAAARDHLRPQTLSAIVHLKTPTFTSEDRLSDVIASIDPLAQVAVIGAKRDSTIDKLKRVLTAGAVAVLLVIGASLLVSIAEQLRERRRVLAVMAAFGTRGSTLAYSVLWQTALPVVLGLTLAIIIGAALGAVLMKILSLPVSFDWGSVALLTGAGLAVVLGVTAFTLPLLQRQISPEALRAE